MADTKITAMSAKATPVSTDIAPIVSDPSGTPKNMYATFANMTKALSVATSAAQGVMSAADFLKVKQIQNGVAAKVTATTLTTADFGKLIPCSGTFTVTLPALAGLATADKGKYYDILNNGTGTITVSAGTEGINRAGNDSLTLVQDQGVRVFLGDTADPAWRSDIESAVTLANAQFAVKDSGGGATAYNLTSAITGSIQATTAGTYTVAYKTPWGMKLDTSDFITNSGGSCTVQVKDDGTAVTPFSVAVAVSATNITKTSTSVTVASGSKLEITIASPSSLTALDYSLNFTRTGA